MRWFIKNNIQKNNKSHQLYAGVFDLICVKKKTPTLCRCPPKKTKNKKIIRLARPNVAFPHINPAIIVIAKIIVGRIPLAGIHGVEMIPPFCTVHFP